nr:MAG TPA: hypothetical protein [Microviridae sp.]
MPEARTRPSSSLLFCRSQRQAADSSSRQRLFSFPFIALGAWGEIARFN